MPSAGDLKVYLDDNLVTEQESISTLCDAVSYVQSNLPTPSGPYDYQSYWYSGSDWVWFGGPRPKYPPAE